MLVKDFISVIDLTRADNEYNKVSVYLSDVSGNRFYSNSYYKADTKTWSPCYKKECKHISEYYNYKVVAVSASYGNSFYLRITE